MPIQAQTEVKLSGFVCEKQCLYCAKLLYVFYETLKKQTLFSLPGKQTWWNHVFTLQISQAERGRQDEPRLKRSQVMDVRFERAGFSNSTPFCFFHCLYVNSKHFSWNAIYAPSTTRTSTRQWQHITGMSPFYNSLKNTVFHYSTPCNYLNKIKTAMEKKMWNLACIPCTMSSTVNLDNLIVLKKTAWLKILLELGNLSEEVIHTRCIYLSGINFNAKWTGSHF